jgi:hypothetical protein
MHKYILKGMNVNLCKEINVKEINVNLSGLAPEWIKHSYSQQLRLSRQPWLWLIFVTLRMAKLQALIRGKSLVESFAGDSAWPDMMTKTGHSVFSYEETQNSAIILGFKKQQTPIAHCARVAIQFPPRGARPACGRKNQIGLTD